MNERIRELAEQAGYTKDMFGVGHWDMPECKKFAEMIVEETLNELCVQMDNLDIDLSNLPRWYKALEKTEQHFRS